MNVSASELTTLHSFTGGTDCAHPYAGLIFDQNGALYGTTYDGGALHQGTVFKLTPPAVGQTAWTETVLHSFTGGTDGAHPYAGLIFDQNGALYGTTVVGGASDFGTVFKLTPPATGQTAWTETVLQSFRGGTDGAYPLAGLIFDQNGALYGTTGGDGAGTGSCVGSCGTVFKLTPPAVGQTAWTETVLHRFGDTDGNSPSVGLIFDQNGALYGATQAGGSSGQGTVFKLTPPAVGQTRWTETVLFAFTSDTDGGLPEGGLIFDQNGVLYGTTVVGGASDIGTVFKLTPPAIGQTAWTETVLYSFTGGTDGGYPDAGLIFDQNGALYSTTQVGGALGNCFGDGCGTVFKLTPPAIGQTAWTETVLYSFTGGTDGAYPVAGLIFDQNGALYGTTGGGVAWSQGTVVKLTPWLISPSSTSVAENAGSLQFKITRPDGSATQTVYVSTAQIEGFTNNNNYVGIADKAVTFAVGQTSKTVTVTIKNNGVREPSKTFAFIVQQNLGDLPSTYLSKATFSIDDVDPLTWSISPPTQSVKDSAGSVAFTLARASGSGAQTIYVSTAQTEGFTNSHDYVPLVNQPVTFADGETSRALAVNIYKNFASGPDKTFALLAQQRTGDPPAVHLAKSAFTIINTSKKAWWISPTARSVHESAGPVQFTVNRSSGRGADTVYVSTAETEGFTNNNNYVGITDQPLVFAESETSRTVTLTVTDNGVIEPNRRFGLIVQANSSDPQTTYLAKSIFTVIDDDGTKIPKLQIVSPYLMPAFQTTPTNLNMKGFLADQKAQDKAQAQGLAADETSEAIVIYQTNGTAPVDFNAAGAILTKYADNFLTLPLQLCCDRLTIESKEFFAVNGKSYAVALVRANANQFSTLRVTASQNGIQATPISLPVVALPVILVHGLWGDHSTWDSLSNYLKKTPPYTSEKYFLPIDYYFLPIDYKNSLPFDADPANDNLPAGETPPWNQLDSTITSIINGFDQAHIVGGRVDIVAHSMGGLVARVYSTKPFRKSWHDRNFGRVHRIITLDTPGKGSPIATYLFNNSESTFNPLTGIGWWWSGPEIVWKSLCGDNYLTAKLWECFAAHGMPMAPGTDLNKGAIASLIPDSPNLARIKFASPKNLGAEWNAIQSQIPSSKNNLDKAVNNQLVYFINRLIAGAGKTDSINSLMNGHLNDGVVSIASQIAGGIPDHIQRIDYIAHAGLDNLGLAFLGVADYNVTSSNLVNSIVACWLVNDVGSCKSIMPLQAAQRAVARQALNLRFTPPIHSRRLAVDQPKRANLALPVELTARVTSAGIERLMVRQRDEWGHIGKYRSAKILQSSGGTVRAQVYPELLGNVTWDVTAIFNDGAVSSQQISFLVGIPTSAPSEFNGDKNFREILLGHIGAMYQLHPVALYPDNPEIQWLDDHCVHYQVVPSTGEPVVQLVTNGSNTSIAALRAGTGQVVATLDCSAAPQPTDVITVIVRPGA